MFELISRRYQNKSTLVTTNRTIRRMARGVPQRRLRRLAGRPSSAQLRDRRHRRRLLSPQGSPRPHRTALTPAPRSQVMSTPPDRTAASPSASAHRRNPPHLDAGGGARGVRADRRICATRSGHSTTFNYRICFASNAHGPSRGWRRRDPRSSARPEPSAPPTEPIGIAKGPDQKSSCCSIKTAIPSSRPALPPPPRAAAVKDARRAPRRRREASWTAASTTVKPQSSAYWVHRQCCRKGRQVRQSVFNQISPRSEDRRGSRADDGDRPFYA